MSALELARYKVGTHNSLVQRKYKIDFISQLMDAVWDIDMFGLERKNYTLEDTFIQLIFEQEDEDLVIYFYETTADISITEYEQVRCRLGTIKDYVENRFTVRLK